MAAALKPESDGAGVGTRKPGVAAGESPTAEMGADATLDFAPPRGPVVEDSHETAATVSLPAGAISDHVSDSDAPTTALLAAADTRKPGPPTPPSSIGRMIGPYTILRELGRGGMGVVYLARHEQLGRTVALKMILAGNQAGTEAQQRFLVEAQSIARLSHPGIVTVYDIGEHEGMPYFSLEYIPGESLAKLVAQQPLEPKAAAALVAKMAAAMQYAHDKGVLHRDLKPANVLMADAETPKITDFGLAKQIEGAQEAELTQAGSIMGTPSYMSPEQASGDLETLGPPTDQYSLGAILYQLLTGRAPFVAPRAFDVIRQVLSNEPVALRKLAPQVPADLETICLKVLHKDAARRYGSCQELAADLTRFLEGRPILARPVGNAERIVRWCRRNPMIAATSGTAVAAVLAVLAVVSWSSYSLTVKNTALETAYGDLETANQNVKNSNTQLEKTNLELTGANDQLSKQNIQLEQRRKQVEEASKLAYDRTKLANGSFRLLIDKARALGRHPPLRAFSKDLVVEAADGLAKLPDDPSDIEANVGLEKAKAEEYLYQTYLDYGEHSKANPHIENALSILRVRNKEQGTDTTRYNLASALLAKAKARQSFERDINLCLLVCEEAIALLESVLEIPVPKVPDDRSKDEKDVRQLLLACRNVKTAMLWQQGSVSSALEEARNSTKLLDETFEKLPILKNLTAEQKRNVRSGMVRLYQIHAVTALRAGEMEEASKQMDEAVDLANLAVRNSPQGWDARLALAEARGFAGDLYVAQKDEAKAREAYEEAAMLARELFAQDPLSDSARTALNIVLIRLAGYEKSRNPEQAAKLYQEALEVARQMVAADPKGQTHQVALALSLAPTGAHNEAKEVADKLLADQKKPDAELLIDMARVYSQCSAATGLKEADSAAYQKSALDCLAKAVDQGYRDQVYLTSHPDFTPLKSAEPFVELIKKISAQKNS